MKRVLKYGWHVSLCKTSEEAPWGEDLPILPGQAGMWAYVFCMSKLPELGDTLFIVLRKQKLIFLHWYHHITVMMYCYFRYGYCSSGDQWFIVMNYFVHSIMYLYYAIRASGHIRPPKWVNMLITSLQLIQMITGLWINTYIYINIVADPHFYCDGKIEKDRVSIYLTFAMYFSYFVLFAHFFYVTYMTTKKPKSVVDNKAEQSVDVVAKNGTNSFHKDTVTINNNGTTWQRKALSRQK